MNKEIMDKILVDEANLAGLLRCKTLEEALAYVNNQGAEANMDELKSVIVSLKKYADDSAMKMEDMDAVAGGNDVVRGIVDTAGFGMQMVLMPYTLPYQLGARALDATITYLEDLYYLAAGED